MEDFKEVELRSGSKLKITLAPFDDSKELLDALLEEAAEVKISGSAEFGELVKNILARGIFSKKINAAFKKCLTRCTYNGHKIDKDTFENRAAREDYIDVMYEVILENVSPFTKSLYAKFSVIVAKVASIPA